jgi:hypothetical protein
MMTRPGYCCSAVERFFHASNFVLFGCDSNFAFQQLLLTRRFGID